MLVSLLATLACTAAPSEEDRAGATADSGGSSADGGTPDGGGTLDGGTTGDDCPDGMICVVDFPYEVQADTAHSTAHGLDAYACAPDTDESGAELIWRVSPGRAGFLSAVVEELEEGVDVDVHILSRLDAGSCLDRGNHMATAHLEADAVYVVVDTYGGDEQAGAFRLRMGHVVPPEGDCRVEDGAIDRVGDGGVPLLMPATGPMAVEAHLVTTADGYGTSASDPWPQDGEEHIDDHYATSEAESGLVLWRDQAWAPQEGCEYGQGSYGDKLPVADEAWYVNMYWQDRPEAGTRMILRDDQGHAVVVAAGYETGPGDLSYVGGATEEVHAWFGTSHGDSLTLGFAVDQELPLGPITCTDD